MEICPHCRSRSAYYERDGKDLLLHCVCGYLKIVFSIAANGTTIVKVQKEKSVELPRKGTNLSKCLGVLVSLYPEGEFTSGLAKRLNQSRGITSNQLVVLRHKGLVVETEIRRGVIGGSRWSLTHRAVRIFGV